MGVFGAVECAVVLIGDGGLAASDGERVLEADEVAVGVVGVLPGAVPSFLL